MNQYHLFHTYLLKQNRICKNDVLDSGTTSLELYMKNTVKQNILFLQDVIYALSSCHFRRVHVMAKSPLPWWKHTKIFVDIFWQFFLHLFV